MAKTANFEIRINGIQQSIDGIESLNKQLDALEARTRSISSSQGAARGSSRSGSLSEEEKLTRQITQLDERREAYSKSIYQNYLAAKDLMKETVNDQKQIAASERLTLNNYTNTMQGMKQELADIKAVMQTVDLGDTDQMKGLTERANQLTQSLKKIEESYGQFGRNVGNYANGVAEGMQKVTIKVGETERTFSNAREASRTLNNELKAMALNGQQGTEAYRDLNEAVKQMNSTIQDTSKSSVAMDNLLDAMQSIASIGAVAKGASSFLGFDNDEIERSIQKLVALQSVMQGIEKINLQMQSGEFLGGFAKKGSEAIDDFTNGLFGLNKASKEATVGLQATAVAEQVVDKSSRVAAVGAKILSTSLKALGIGFLIAIVAALAEGISKLGSKISGWVKGNADLIDSNKSVQNSISTVNKVLEEEIRLIEARQKAGQISANDARIRTEEAYAEAIEHTNEVLETQIRIASRRGDNKAFANAALGNTSWQGDEGVTTFGGFRSGLKTIEDLEYRWKALSKAVQEGSGIIGGADKRLDTLNLTASDTRDELSHLEQIVAGDLLKSFRMFNLSTEDGRDSFLRFVEDIRRNGNEVQKSVLFRMSDILSEKSPELRNALDGYLKIVNDFTNKFNSETDKLNVLGIANGILDSADPTRALREQRSKLEAALVDMTNNLSDTERKRINDAIAQVDKQIAEAGRKHSNSITSVYKKMRQATEDADRRFSDLTIRLMNSRFDKEMAQLDENNKRETEAIRKNGVKVQELLKLQNDAYVKERKGILDEYIKGINDDLASIESDRLASMLESTEIDLEDALDKLSNVRKSKSTYSGDKGYLSSLLGLSVEDLSIAKKYMTVMNTLKVMSDKNDYLGHYKDNGLEPLSDEDFRLAKESLENAVKMYEENFSRITEIVKSNSYLINSLEDETFVDSWERRYDSTNEIYAKYVGLLKKLIMNRKEILIQSENDDAERQKEAARKEYDALFSTEDTEEARKLNEALLEKYNKKIEQIEYSHSVRLAAIEKDTLQTTTEANRTSLDTQLSDINDFISKANQIIDSQPIHNEKWEFVNLDKTNKETEEVMKVLEKLKKTINEVRSEASFAFTKGSMSQEDFNSINEGLDEAENRIAETMKTTTKKVKDAKEDLRKQIFEMIDITLNAASDILDSISSIQESAFEKQMDAIDKENELLEKKLDKQREITQKYADKVNDIEDELADSRGDRRQFLIDQLNAQSEAQRRSLEEEKKVERQQEELDKKKQKLEEEERKRQKKVAIWQAVLNAALAISNAAVNKWPIPALPMIAAATAVGAAQIAAVSKAKYAEGGLLVGKSHREGGIKVLGGQAEVEGGEYVTNKRTTASNLALLEFINSKKKKVDLADMVDFYNGKKTVSSISKMKFASGGQLPLMRTDIRVNSQLVRAMEEYSERPVVVSVVDVISKADNVRQVQTLAGLK